MTTVPRWTEGVCGDAVIILRDGVPVPISEILRILNSTPTASTSDDARHQSMFLSDENLMGGGE